MEVIIGKDIREYEPKDIGPFTIAQAVWLAIAGVCSIAGYIFASTVLGMGEPNETTAIVCLACAAPGLYFGFMKINGLPPLTYFKETLMANYLTPTTRVYESDYTLTEEDLELLIDYDIKEEPLTKEEQKRLKAIKTYK